MDKYTYSQKLNMLWGEKKFDAALTLIDQYLSEEPQNSEALCHKAMVFGMLGKEDESLEAAEIAIIADSQNAQNYHTKGVALLHKKKYADAIKAFDQSLGLGGGNKITKKIRIDALILSGRCSEAARSFENSDLPELTNMAWWNNLGYMYIVAGNLEKAGHYLYGAKVLNKYEPLIYLNLMRLWRKKRDYIRAVKHGIAYYFLRFAKQIGLLKKYHSSVNRYDEHISEADFYSNGGTVYSSDSQIRETRSILKLLHSPNAMALCNDTFQWFAINIPYAAAGTSGVNGDIDIIVKRPDIEGFDAGFKYRGFQVKTVIVNREGHVRSAKRGKSQHRTILKQLKVLKNFGCEQIFFLELYILERRYSQSNQFPSPEIFEEIKSKANMLKNTGFGYVVMAEEPSPDKGEHEGGVWHFPANVLEAKNFPIKQTFQDLVDKIDKFRSSKEFEELTKDLSRNQQHWSHVGYCPYCKKITLYVPGVSGEYFCLRCKEHLT